MSESLDLWANAPPSPAPTEDIWADAPALADRAPALARTNSPTEIGLGDYARGLWIGTVGLGAAAAGLAEWAGNPAAGQVRQSLQDEADYQLQRMSDKGRDALTASLLPEEGQPGFFDNPDASLALKATATLPSLVASIIPGGLVARGLAAAGATAARVGAGAAVGGTNFGLSAGDVFASIAQQVENVSDEELRKQSSTYDFMRASGEDEATAKRNLIREAAAYKPLYAGLISAAAGALLEGRAVADIATGAVQGVGRAARHGALNEGGEELIQTGGEEIFAALGFQDATGKPLNYQQILANTLEGGLLGATMGGGLGAVGGAVRPPAPAPAGAPAPQAAPPVTPPAPTPAGPAPTNNIADPAQIAALGNRPSPAPSPAQPLAPAPAPAPPPAPMASVSPAPAPGEAGIPPAPVQTPPEPRRPSNAWLQDFAGAESIPSTPAPPAPTVAPVPTAAPAPLEVAAPAATLSQQPPLAPPGLSSNPPGSEQTPAAQGVAPLAPEPARAAPAPATAAPAPVTPEVKLTGPQQAALDRLEDRVRGVARSERIPDGLLDSIISDVKAELQGEVQQEKGGASEIAGTVLKRVDLPQLISQAVARYREGSLAADAEEEQANERALLQAQARAEAAKVGRKAARTTETKTAAPRAEEDWRTVVSRARKVLETQGEGAPQVYKDIVGYAASQTRGGNNKVRAAAQAKLREAEREHLATQQAPAEAQPAAAEVTLAQVLDQHPAPGGREKASDFTQRMKRVVEAADAAGVSDPFLTRVKAALAKAGEGALKLGEAQRLQADEFTTRRKAEVKGLDAETRALEADVRAPKARFREGLDEEAQAEADAAEFGDGRVLSMRSGSGEGSIRRLGPEGYHNEFHPDGSVTLRDLDGKAIHLPAKRRTSVKTILGLTEAESPGDGMLRRVIRTHIPDVPVVMLSRAELTQFAGDPDTQALFFKPDSRERAAGEVGFIALNAEGGDDAGFSMYFHHEAVHALTQFMLDQNKPLREAMGKLARHVERHLRSKGARPPGMEDRKWQEVLYYTSNQHELAAGALTDETFQEILAQIEVTPEMASQLGLENQAPKSLWEAFLQLLRKAFGLPAEGLTALDAAIRLTGRAVTTPGEARRAAQTLVDPFAAEPGALFMRSVKDRLQDLQDAAPGLAGGAKAATRQVGLGLMTQRQIVEAYRKDFGWTDDTRQGAKADDPLTQVQRAIQQRGVKAHHLREQAEPLVRRLSRLAKDKPQAAAELGDLMVQATMFGVDPTVDLTHASNKHLGKGLGNRQARAAHPKLAARWAALKRGNPEVEDVWNESLTYFQNQHREMGRLLVKNLLENRQIQLERQAREAGRTFTPKTEAELDAMAKRWLAKKTTDDDAKWAGDAYAEHVKRVRNLARTKGPYFPLRRFGDFVLTWEEGKDSEFTFATQKDAEDFLDSSDLAVLSVRKQSYDDQGKRLNANDLKDPNVSAAREEWVVRVQNKGVEFFDSYREAAARRQELAKGDKYRLSEVERRRDDARVRLDLLPEQMRALVSATRAMNLPEDRARDTERAIEQAALRLLPGTSARSSLIQRRKVIGASTDALRATANYANASANFLAKLEYGPQITHGLEAMADHIEENRFDGSGRTIKRQEVLREMRMRNQTDALDVTGGGAQSRVLRALQSLTFVNYLASPAYTLINLMQPWLVGAPYLAARYGAGRTSRAMAEATNLVGGRGLLTQGVLQSGRHVKEFLTGKDANRSDFLAMVKHEVAASKARDAGEITAMIDELAGEGLIDLSAGMELNRAMRGESWTGSKLRQVEDFARALPSAAEVLNRTVMGVAAYRLARRAGKSKSQSVQAARDAVSNTQFDYTSANTARFMDPRRNPLLAPAFTFRKYAQGMYWLLGRQVYVAFKGASAAERKEARRTLAGVLASHTLMAGMLGLPTEPIKIALGVMAFALGEDEPWDFEREIRQAMADIFGADLAEVLTRGLPRAAGVDLSTRVGLDSLLFTKDVRDFKRESVQDAVVEMLIGAPGSMVMNWVGGMEAARRGDFGRAFEAAVPVKAVRDIAKTMRFADEGVTTKRGERIDPGIGGPDLFWQALGFQPSVVAETYARRDAVKGAERRLSETRRQLTQDYAQAKPEDRAKVWARIREWNKDQPAAARITFESLRKSLRERTRRTNEADAGTFLPKNRRFLLREGDFANVR